MDWADDFGPDGWLLREREESYAQDDLATSRAAATRAVPSQVEPHTFARADVRDYAPRDLALRDFTPRDLALRDYAPRDFAPRDLALRDTSLPPRDKYYYVRESPHACMFAHTKKRSRKSKERRRERQRKNKRATVAIDPVFIWLLLVWMLVIVCVVATGSQARARRREDADAAANYSRFTLHLLPRS
jgi:hypothetical protein